MNRPTASELGMNRRDQRGLTLVEVLIAIVIIAVAFVALSASQIANLRVTRDSQQSSLATQAANEVLELTSQRILENYAAYQACPAGSGCTGSVAKGQFTVTYAISRSASDYRVEGLILVSITVSGPASASLSHYVSCMDVSPPPTVKTPGVCA